MVKIVTTIVRGDDTKKVHSYEPVSYTHLDVYKRQPLDGLTAVCVFDLNNLRTINNNLGHEKGDEYIRSFAVELRKRCV